MKIVKNSFGGTKTSILPSAGLMRPNPVDEIKSSLAEQSTSKKHVCFSVPILYPPFCLLHFSHVSHVNVKFLGVLHVCVQEAGILECS